MSKIKDMVPESTNGYTITYTSDKGGVIVHKRFDSNKQLPVIDCLRNLKDFISESEFESVEVVPDKNYWMLVDVGR